MSNLQEQSNSIDAGMGFMDKSSLARIDDTDGTFEGVNDDAFPSDLRELEQWEIPGAARSAVSVDDLQSSLTSSFLDLEKFWKENGASDKSASPIQQGGNALRQKDQVSDTTMDLQSQGGISTETVPYSEVSTSHPREQASVLGDSSESFEGNVTPQTRPISDPGNSSDYISELESSQDVCMPNQSNAETLPSVYCIILPIPDNVSPTFLRSPHLEDIQNILQEYLTRPETSKLLNMGLHSFIVEKGYCSQKSEVVAELIAQCANDGALISKLMQIVAFPNTSEGQVGTISETNAESIPSVQNGNVVVPASGNETVVLSSSREPVVPPRAASLSEKIEYLKRKLPEGILRSARVDMDRCSGRIKKIEAGGNVLFPALFSTIEILEGNMSGKKSDKNPLKKKYNEFKVDAFSELLAWLVNTRSDVTFDEFEQYQISTRSSGLIESEFDKFKQYFLVDYANRLRGPKKKELKPVNNVPKKRINKCRGSGSDTVKRIKKL